MEPLDLKRETNAKVLVAKSSPILYKLMRKLPHFSLDL